MLRRTVRVEEYEAGGYVATAPAFPGVVDQGETEEEGEELPASDAGRSVVREVELAV